MTDHQHPPLSLPGCRASQPLVSHHHHFFHHDCHGHHHQLHRHHHHHHLLHQQHCHHHYPFCRQHRAVYHQAGHFNLTPCVASSLHLPAVSLPEQPHVGYSVSTQNHQNEAASACKDVENSGVQLHEEWTDELEEEEEEPVFVMTDEWMEFFAKSEAKRKLEKQAKKKKAKN